MTPHVVPDDSNVQKPRLTYEDAHTLNRLTAYNRPSLTTYDGPCGCFHCGSTFRAEQITSWMHEEDGDDTALCPYCGVDAVIRDTEQTAQFPVSTALLTKLYMEWFEEEFKERMDKATFVPTFHGRDDYFHKGIPFLMNDDQDIEVVGEIGLFPTRIFDDEWGDVHNNENFARAMRKIAEEGSRGVMRVSAYFDDQHFYCADIIDETGLQLPYEPWTGGQQDLLLKLAAQYGPRLRGLIKMPGAQTMQLFVER